jgi:hypothetical protein
MTPGNHYCGELFNYPVAGWPGLPLTLELESHNVSDRPELESINQTAIFYV